MLTDESIQEYKAIYRKEFGEDIADAEAREQAKKLLDLMRILLDSRTD